MGGKSKKGGTAAVIKADDMFNQDTVEMGFAIGEGTIYGLTDGLKTMYVDGTPIQSETGELNFQDLGISIRQGYMDDQPMRYFMGGETSTIATSTGVTLPADITRNFTTPPQFRGRLSFIDIRLAAAALYSGDSKGNVSGASILMEVKYRKSGTQDWRYVLKTSQDLTNYRRRVKTLVQIAQENGLKFEDMTEEEQFAFELQVLQAVGNVTAGNILAENAQMVDYLLISQGHYNMLVGTSLAANLRVGKPRGSWLNVEHHSILNEYKNQVAGLTIEQLRNQFMVIEGKTTAGYIYELSIPVFDDKDADHDWEIQITRKSRELTAEEKRFSGKTISIDAIALTTESERTYPKVATCHIVAQHTDRFSQIPEFTGEFDGLMCDVPTNYNPYDHTWSGAWDGNFKRAWTNNNALILRELHMNRDWGKRSTEPLLAMDNTSLLEAAQYCDELLEDLEGNFKPRHTFNMVVQQQQTLDEFIELVAGSFRATTREIFGTIHIFIDRPKNPNFFVSADTVLQTGFQYSMADLQSQYNEMRIAFVNAQNNYQEDRRRIVDEDSILKNGYIPYQMMTVGVTNVTEALRHAVYMMLTNRDETTFTNFTQPRLGHIVNLYDNFYLLDKDSGWGTGGRIRGYDASTGLITLRDPILMLPQTEQYKIGYHRPAGLTFFQAISVNPTTLQVVGTPEDWNTHGHLIEDMPLMIEGGSYGRGKVFRILEVSQSDSDDIAQGEIFNFKACNVSSTKYVKADNVQNPSMVELKYESEILTFNRGKEPSEPKNIVMRHRDATDSSGQMAYSLAFTAEIEANQYHIQWVNERTREIRSMYMQSTEGIISPAFPYGEPITLIITAVDNNGNKGKTTTLMNLNLRSEMEAKMPNILSMEYKAASGGVVFTWSEDPADMFEYSKISVAYRSPLQNKMDIVIPKGTRNFTVPYEGEGNYVLNLSFIVDMNDGLGYAGSIVGNNWTYQLDSSGSTNKLTSPTDLSLSVVTGFNIRRGTIGVETVRAPDGECFIDNFSFRLPSRGSDPALSAFEKPFGIYYNPSNDPNVGNWTEQGYGSSGELVFYATTVVPRDPHVSIRRRDVTTLKSFRLGGWFRLTARAADGGVSSPRDSDMVQIRIPVTAGVAEDFNPVDIYNQQK